MVKRHCECFLLLVTVVELLIASSRRFVDPLALRDAYCQYLSLFKDLFGPQCVTPKFHMAMHLWNFMLRFGFVPNCFVLERKHRVAKRFGDAVTNANSNWGRFVLREVTCNHLASLADSTRFQTGSFLCGACRPIPERHDMLKQAFADLHADPGSDFLIAREVRINAWEAVAEGDVVMVRDEGGQTFVGTLLWSVSARFGGRADVLSAVTKWELVSQEARACKWLPRNDIMLCFAREIVCALISAGPGRGKICTTLKPCRV